MQRVAGRQVMVHGMGQGSKKRDRQPRSIVRNPWDHDTLAEGRMPAAYHNHDRDPRNFRSAGASPSSILAVHNDPSRGQR